MDHQYHDNACEFSDSYDYKCKLCAHRLYINLQTNPLGCITVNGGVCPDEFVFKQRKPRRERRRIYRKDSSTHREVTHE